MVAKIDKAAGNVITDELLVDFLALANLEQQTAFVFGLCVAAQVAFNATPPATLVNRFAASASYANKTLTLQGSLPLSDTAIGGTLVAGVNPAGINATKLDKDAGDTATGTDFVEFLGLASLEKQLIWLCVKLSVLENQYNTANPNANLNRTTLTPDYDGNSVAVQVSLPLSNDAVLNPLHTSVTAYL